MSTAAGRRLDTAEQRRFARIAVWLLVVTIGYNVVEGTWPWPPACRPDRSP